MDAETDTRITIAAVLIGYPKDALIFVLGGWSEFEVYNQSHIDGETLCWRLHDYALKLYGSDARKQLSDWKITTTSDFGNIVFGLVDHGLVRTTESDKIDDFEGVFEFESQFLEPKNAVVKPSRQWSLSTLFFLTTLAAIAISGFTRGGIDGIFPALLSSWLTILGLSCMIMGIRSRSSGGWLFLFWFGIVSLAAGIFAFFTISYW